MLGRNILYFFIIARGLMMITSAAYIAAVNWSYMGGLSTLPSLHRPVDIALYIFNLWYFSSNFFAGYMIYKVGCVCIERIMRVKYGQFFILMRPPSSWTERQDEKLV